MHAIHNHEVYIKTGSGRSAAESKGIIRPIDARWLRTTLWRLSEQITANSPEASNGQQMGQVVGDSLTSATPAVIGTLCSERNEQKLVKIYGLVIHYFLWEQ